VARYVLGIVILVVALWVISSHRDELSPLSGVIDHLNWWWVIPAVIVELASYFCFAAMQYGILLGGGLKTPWAPLVNMTFATQAIANSLPAGTAVAFVYGFRWYRRFGADDAVAVWALAGTAVASTASLALVAAGGLTLATGEGASLDLVPVILGVLLLTIAVGALFVYERPLVAVVTWSIRASRKLTGRPRGDAEEQISLALRWLTTARLGWRQIVRIVAWGAGNWLLDCSCFAMMFLAAGTSIPWKGLLLAYGAGQLAATLPITPGGLGVVEGSITIALVAFGGDKTTTLDAVLLYRVISFWFILLLGWVLWGYLGLQVRRGIWSREVRDAEVEAGIRAASAMVGTSGPGDTVGMASA
jgi:uncharacterized protein (TIRG00374 family)